MTAQQIFRHERLNFNDWLSNLLNVERRPTLGKKKKMRTTIFRRHQERFVKRLVDMVQKLTLAPSQISLGGKRK
jgi:hypothetical protein